MKGTLLMSPHARCAWMFGDEPEVTPRSVYVRALGMHLYTCTGAWLRVSGGVCVSARELCVPPHVRCTHAHAGLTVQIPGPHPDHGISEVEPENLPSNNKFPGGFSWVQTLRTGGLGDTLV